MLAAKSAAPKLIACNRGDAAAISSTWAIPAAVSMITSRLIRFLRPAADQSTQQRHGRHASH